MPKNQQRLYAWIGLGAGLAGLAAFAAALALGAAAGGFQPAGLVLGPLLAAAGFASAWVYFRRARIMDDVLDPAGQLIHWTYPDVSPGDDERFREVIVGRRGMWFDGQLRPYRGRLCFLLEVGLREGFLDLTFSMAQGNSRLAGTCEVPIPAGEEARARAAAAFLSLECGLERRR